MDRAHSQGRRVVYWTLNDAAEMAACIAIGADGFFTDDVPLGRAALRAAGLLPQQLEPLLDPGSDRVPVARAPLRAVVGSALMPAAIAEEEGEEEWTGEE